MSALSKRSRAAAIPLLWIFLLCARVHAALAADGGCDVARVALEITGDSIDMDVYFGIPSPFGLLPSQQRPEALPLTVADPEDACSSLGSRHFAGSAVVVERGGCTFLEKAQALSAAHAAAMIVYNTEEGCFAMGLNSSLPTPALNITAVSVSRSTGLQLMADADAGAKVALWLPRSMDVDPSAAVLWLLAVSTAVAAALWAGSDFAFEAKCIRSTPDDEEGVHGRPSEGAHKTSCKRQAKQGGDGPFVRVPLSQGAPRKASGLEVQVVTVQTAVGFVIFASLMLMLLYFFLNHMFAIVLTVMFSFAAIQALTAVLSACFGRIAPRLQSLACELWGCGTIDYVTLAACVPATLIVVVWFVGRHTVWAWPLQDAMGVALIMMLLRQFRLPDIKVACILLPLCFLYDIFWVFITPVIMGGKSVMVEVASGGDSHEVLPMLLIVPTWFGGASGGMMLLGFGDVVLPGLLLVYARVFDLQHHRSLCSSYFVPASIGYGVGLMLTYGALYLQLGGDQGQPALLYLIPCTLGTVMLLSWCRGDLPAMWKGLDPPDLPEGPCKGRLPSILEEDEDSDIEHGLLIDGQ